MTLEQFCNSCRCLHLKGCKVDGHLKLYGRPNIPRELQEALKIFERELLLKYSWPEYKEEHRNYSSPLPVSEPLQENRTDLNEKSPIEALKVFVEGFMPGFANHTKGEFERMNGDITKIREFYREKRVEQEKNKDNLQYGLFYRYYDGIVREIERILSDLQVETMN